MSKKEEKQGINSVEFDSAIGQICEEKGLNKERVLETVEAALAAAYKKDYGKKSQNIKAVLDRVSGQVKFYLLKEVVDEATRSFADSEETEKDNKKEKKKEEETEEKLPRFNAERDILLADAKKIKKDAKVGDVLETELESKEDYGRVAAQTAKQVIIQKIREAEREAMYEEYKEKEGQVLNGTVQRVEGHNVFIDLGKAVGILFPSEQIKNESYHIGQRVKVYLGKIEEDKKGAGILLSRTHPQMVARLFEMEVPEIFAGTVEIKNVARIAGARSKVAVVANEEGLDPIGSCVGQKGTRVQAVIDELNGEKIDIIEWQESPDDYIVAALSPAKVTEIVLDEKNKTAKVFVPDDQLSLAIGQQGQNVRLASELTGWTIDVVSDEEDTPEKKETPVESVEESEEEKEPTEKKAETTEEKEDSSEKETTAEK